ncbi:EAL domain-containing protein [Burkholderia ubonensis]|uniref:EAL domain-containing protein n=1 Tax=Burkholderia ubonensis TaxID=101571 RepID=UPI000770C502|nr:EAL domain-containing protein [Burkholderia ubonensis]KVW68051.1 hypothetical protein WK99_10375 [Burkholderia ubonensis]
MDLVGVEAHSSKCLSADMAMVSRVEQALTHGRFDFAFQPVHCVWGRQPALYHQCLVRITDSNGLSIPSSRFLPVLSRLGLNPWFDGHVFGRVLRLLPRYPNLVLGVSLSADSLNWSGVLAGLTGRPDWARRLVTEEAGGLVELGKHPEWARRLVIEVAEQSPLEAEDYLQLARFRQLGCRIAVADFGEGFALSNALQMGSCDMVKIGGAILRTGGQALLRQMIALAREMSECIVIEGVETEDELKRVQEAGGQWAQGFYFGPPVQEFHGASMA